MNPRHVTRSSFVHGDTLTLLCFAAANFLIHMAFAGNYGYFRDELYYIVSGQHLQLGYVDFPPMIAYLAALLALIAGDSLVSIHLVPALAGAALVFVAGSIARELGGDRWAQALAAVGTLVTAQLAFSSIFSMDILDALWWSLCAYLLIRTIHRGTPRLWLLFGLVAGLGLFTKLTMVFFLLSLLVGIAFTPARTSLRSRWFWSGALVAVAFLVPYALWNASNGWPTVDFYIHHGGLSGGGPLEFVALQILIANPVNLPLVFAGLYFLLGEQRGRPYRLLGVALVFLFILFFAINAKPYFYEPAYPILIGAGAVVAARGMDKVRFWIPRLMLVGLAISGVLIAPLEMPLLPPAAFVGTYSSLTGVANGAAAQGNAGQFPQYLGDRFGWDTLVRTVSQVYASLPGNERSSSCVFASNYGEASALIFLGKSYGIRQVISSHNNYYIWGPGSCGTVLITVGVSLAQLKMIYNDVTLAATVTCNYCMTSEDNLPVYVATNPNESLAAVWPLIRDFS